MAAEPDGYTLLLGTAATHGVNPVLYAASGVDPVRDFACIGTIADMPNVLSVNPQVLDVASVASLVAEARRRPLSYASVGNGSSSHFCAAMFLRAAGIEATHVPYRGSAPAIAALRGGEVAFLFDTTATSTMQIRAGAFRALAVTAAHRSAALPDVPTLIEAGLPGYDIAVWNALCLHRRAPAAVLARLREAFAAAMAPPMDDRLRGAFVEPLRIPAAELDAWQAADQAKWMRMTRELNMAVD
jgi:tripartite-type tricarboxylate transporter receptor subunit TctC